MALITTHRKDNEYGRKDALLDMNNGTNLTVGNATARGERAKEASLLHIAAYWFGYADEVQDISTAAIERVWTRMTEQERKTFRETGKYPKGGE